MKIEKMYKYTCENCGKFFFLLEKNENLKCPNCDLNFSEEVSNYVVRGGLMDEEQMEILNNVNKM